MAFMAYKQQTIALGIAVLLLAAVGAPMCVMFAEPAMAMPMPMSMPMSPSTDETPAPASQDCDEDESLGQCPHASSTGAPATAPRTDVQSDLALPAVSDILVVPVDFGPVEASAYSGQLPPPAHLTPLRL